MVTGPVTMHLQALARFLTYTPDGKQLLLVGSNTVYDTAKTDRYLLFYDTATYELLPRETVTGWRLPIVRNDAR